MKKLSNKILLIGLAGLILIFAASRFFRSPKRESNLRKDLLKLDTAAVNEVRILPSKDNSEELRLTRSGNSWRVSKGSRTEPVNRSAIQGVLGTIANLQAQRMVSRKKEKWEDFNVGTKSTHVSVYAEGKTVADFHVGKLGFSQGDGQMMGGTYTYVRLSDESEVYTVEGFLQPTFDNAFNDWRDKTFLKVNKDDITEVKFNYASDSGFVFTKKDSVWYVDSSPADPSKVASYLNRMSSAYLTDFADEFKPTSKPDMIMNVNGKSGNLITVEGWRKENDWILTSTVQKGIYFTSKGSQAVNDILIGKGKLLTSKK